MNFETILQIATLLTLVIGIIGILVKINDSRRQISTSLFIEYAKRYDDIVNSFPKAAWARLANGEILEENVEITICVYRFLHFLAGAFYFYRKGYLDKQAWSIWQGEVHTLLRSPVIRREWRKFADEHSLTPEFHRYVERVQTRTAEVPWKKNLSKEFSTRTSAKLKTAESRGSVEERRNSRMGYRPSKTNPRIRKSI